MNDCISKLYRHGGGYLVSDRIGSKNWDRDNPFLFPRDEHRTHRHINDFIFSPFFNCRSIRIFGPTPSPTSSATSSASSSSCQCTPLTPGSACSSSITSSTTSTSIPSATATKVTVPFWIASFPHSFLLAYGKRRNRPDPFSLLLIVTLANVQC